MGSASPPASSRPSASRCSPGLLINKKVAPYFFLGFVLMAYLKIPVTGIAILGAIVAVVMVNVTALNSPRITTEQGVSDDDEDDF